MSTLTLTSDDVATLQAAVENMRSASSSDEERNRIIESRWRIASKIEAMLRRVRE